jgi:hypothetical protein
MRVGFHDEVSIKATDHLTITVTKTDGTSWTEEF